jgi:hypothetical protein
MVVVKIFEGVDLKMDIYRMDERVGLLLWDVAVMEGGNL